MIHIERWRATIARARATPTTRGRAARQPMLMRRLSDSAKRYWPAHWIAPALFHDFLQPASAGLFLGAFKDCRGRSKIRPPGRHRSGISNADPGMIRSAARLSHLLMFGSP